MFTLSVKQYKIYKTIILFILDTPQRMFNSFMMDNFVRLKGATQMFCHNKTVFSYIALMASHWILGGINFKIFIGGYSFASFPMQSFFALPRTDYATAAFKGASMKAVLFEQIWFSINDFSTISTRDFFACMNFMNTHTLNIPQRKEKVNGS